MRLVLLTALLSTGLACGYSDDTPELPVLADPCAAFTAPGLYKFPVTVDGVLREPNVYVPALPEGPRPAVLMLHGAGSNGRRAASFTDFRERAEAYGVVALYPNGTGLGDSYTWNAGTCCGSAEKRAIADLDYLDAVVDEARDRLCVDKVHGVGHSNGGMMIARWACSRDTLSTAVTSAGPLLTSSCGSEPRPFLAWHGDADTVVPYEGGGDPEVEVFPAAEKAFELVRERNRCTDAPPSTEQIGDLTCQSWTCEQPSTFCRIADWPHAWPGGSSDRLGNPPIEDQAFDWFGLFLPIIDSGAETDAPRDTDG